MRWIDTRTVISGLHPDRQSNSSRVAAVCVGSGIIHTVQRRPSSSVEPFVRPYILDQKFPNTWDHCPITLCISASGLRSASRTIATCRTWPKPSTLRIVFSSTARLILSLVYMDLKIITRAEEAKKSKLVWPLNHQNARRLESTTVIVAGPLVSCPLSAVLRFRHLTSSPRSKARSSIA